MHSKQRRLHDLTMTPADPTYADEQAQLPPQQRDANEHAWGLLSDALCALEFSECRQLYEVLSELAAAYDGNHSPDSFRGWDQMEEAERKWRMQAWRLGVDAAREDAKS